MPPDLGVQSLRPQQHFSFAAEVDSSRRINTGLALANHNGVPQTVIVNVIRSDGTLYETAKVDLLPWGHRSLYLTELFPGLDGFAGTIGVSAPQPVGALALRQDQDAMGAVMVLPEPTLGAFLLDKAPVEESEPNGTGDLAAQVQESTVITGEVSFPGDVDYVRFTGRQGDIITAVVDTDSLNSKLRSNLTLEGSDGSVIAENSRPTMDGSGASFLQLAIPDDGIYYLRVSDTRGEGGDQFTYRLHVTIPASRLPGITTVFPSNLALGSVYPLLVTINGSNLDGATSILTYPPGRILIKDLVATGSRIDAHVSLAANTPTGIYTLYVLTPFGLSNGVTLTLTNPGTRDFDGYWQGTTAEGFEVSLTVTNGGIERYSFSYSVPGCGGALSGIIIPPLAIRGNMFTLSSPYTPLSFTMTGAFSSNSASGTLSIPLSGRGSCTTDIVTTWTAHR